MRLLAHGIILMISRTFPLGGPADHFVRRSARVLTGAGAVRGPRTYTCVPADRGRGCAPEIDGEELLDHEKVSRASLRELTLIVCVRRLSPPQIPPRWSTHSSRHMVLVMISRTARRDQKDLPSIPLIDCCSGQATALETVLLGTSRFIRYM